MRKASFSLLRIMLVALTLMVSAGVNAQLIFPEEKVQCKFFIEQEDDEATIIAKVTIEDGWKIFAAHPPEDSFFVPTILELYESSNYKVEGEILEQKFHFEYDELAEENLYYHKGKTAFKRKIKVTSQENFVVQGKFEFQACNEEMCLPPYQAEIKLEVKGLKNK